PVAPHRANVEQDGLVLGLRQRKRRLAPLMPADRLMRRRAQIGRSSLPQRVLGRSGHLPSVARQARSSFLTTATYNSTARTSSAFSTCSSAVCATWID